MNHFRSVPRWTFRIKMVVPTLGVLCLGIAVMGMFADQEMFRPHPLKTANSADVANTVETAAGGGIQHWKTMIYFGTHIPEVCWGENAVNEFQKKQCTEFWDHLQMGGALAALPFAMMWVFWILAMSSFTTTYRRAQKKIQAGKPILSGMVTSPAQAPDDLFSWFFCMRAIGVQLASQEQMKVYIPLDAPIPLPGQTMAVFEPSTSFGASRHIATIYAPHVAVMTGTRR